MANLGQTVRIQNNKFEIIVHHSENFFSFEEFHHVKITTYVDQFHITTTTLVGHTRQMRIPLLAVFAHHSAIVVRILSEEFLRIAIRIDVDLRQSIVNAWIIGTVVNTSFEPR